MENLTPIGVALIGALAIIIPAYLLHKREEAKFKLEIRIKNAEIKKHFQEKEEHRIKAEVLNRILDFSAFNKIAAAVDELFKTTRADRFLILIAVNGKTDFNIVSVIFEQHKKASYKINAIAKYRNLSIDEDYKAMLKRSEKYGLVELKTTDMKSSLLKDIYIMENIIHSDVRHLLRIQADQDNDILIYSSLSTHNSKGFTTLGKRKADLVYDSEIKTVLSDVLRKEY